MAEQKKEIPTKPNNKKRWIRIGEIAVSLVGVIITVATAGKIKPR